MPQITLGQDVIHSTPIDPNNPLTDTDVQFDNTFANTLNTAACQPGQYAVNAAVHVIPPNGYVVSGTLQDTSPTVTFSCGSGGGGGGGCATATPSVSGQPAARRPDIIVCQ